MPTIDIDREAAHDAAARELAKPIYPKASLHDRFAEWVNDVIHRLMIGGSSLPGGWLTVVVLAALVLAAVVVAVRIARRTMGRPGDRRLYGDRTLTAADYRERADVSAAQRDWAAAIRQRVRAIGRQLEEDGAVAPVPGRTAVELAREAGSALPDLAGQFSTAATVFNDVTYGDQAGSERNYRLVADLDDRVCRESAPARGTR